MKKNVGYCTAGLGVFFVILCLTADLLGLGRGGVQAKQILGINVGFLMVFLGVGLARMAPIENIPGVSKWFRKFLALPTITWVLVGFLITFVAFFIFPVFFNEHWRMWYIFNYIPDMYPIGSDMLHNTSAIREWMLGNNPYTVDGHFYPPLYHVVFSPLAMMEYPSSYYVMTAITLVSFGILTFVIPILFEKKKDVAIILFFFLTGLFSYGLQFELERGQYNTLAFLLCVFAIYLFYYHKQFRYLAYLIFSIGVQIKLYPVIFVVLFVEDWKDWKTNIKRLAGLAVFNVGLLFVMGPNILVNFLEALTSNTTKGKWFFPGNHSIAGFAYNLTHAGYSGISTGEFFSVLKGNSTIVQIIITAYVVLCLCLIFYKVYKRNNGQIDADLILACILGAMLIPTVSIDYKLQLLAFPMAFAFANREMPEKIWQKIIFIFLIVLASVAYSLTLVPYKYREYGIFINSLPALVTILTTVTVLNLMNNHKKIDAIAPVASD